jgi:starch synthase (maltosyl-transferring)
MSPTLPSGGGSRVAIERVTPSVDNGRFPVKRTLGDVVHVEADIFADGHDAIAAVLATRHSTANSWVEIAMQDGNNDVWSAEFTVSDLGSYFYTIRAWVDHFETWRRDLVKRLDARIVKNLIALKTR